MCLLILYRRSLVNCMPIMSCFLLSLELNVFLSRGYQLGVCAFRATENPCTNEPCFKKVFVIGPNRWGDVKTIFSLKYPNAPENLQIKGMAKKPIFLDGSTNEKVASQPLRQASHADNSQIGAEDI